MKKKITLCLMASLLSLTAVAQTPVTKDTKADALSLNPSIQLKADSASGSLDPYVSEIITEAPAGEEHANLMRSETAFYRGSYGVGSRTEDGFVGNYVKADDGRLYVKWPIAQFRLTGYMMLEPVDSVEGEYVAHMPQKVYVATNDDPTEGIQEVDLYLMRLKRTEGEDGYWYYPVGDSIEGYYDVYFSLSGDTLKSTNLDEENILAMATLDGEWTGYGDYNIVMTENPYEKVTLPDSAKIETYTLTDGDVIFETFVAFDGDDVYFNNPYSNDKVLWYKGTLSDNTVTLKGQQYMGVENKIDRHVFFVPCTFDEDWYLHPAEQIQLSYNPDTKVMTYKGDIAVAVSYSPSKLAELISYYTPTYTPYEEKPATPVDPEITTLGEYYEGYGAEMVVNMPARDTEGNWINPEKVYYNLYFDGSEIPVTLKPTSEGGSYSKLTTSMTNIPYNYRDGEDFYLSNEEHTIYLHQQLDSVGVSVTYTGGGEEHQSNIVWAVTPEYATGISAVGAKDVKRVVYYDLTGRMVTRPSHGTVIRQTIYGDGTKKSEVVIR